MVDSPKPGKLSKLGKLFGKSSTNLSSTSQQSVATKPKLSSPTKNAQPKEASETVSATNSPKLKEPVYTNTSSILSPASSDFASPQPTSNDEDFILSQVENDEVSPLRQIKQPQPQQPHKSSPLAQHSQPSPSLNQSPSSNASPKLAKTRSQSPVNGSVSTTTSPMSVASLDNKLKKHTIASVPPPASSAQSGERHPSSSSIPSSRPSPNVSRSSSRKIASSIKQAASSSNAQLTKNKNDSTTSLNSLAHQPQQPPQLPRFVMLENGNHEHHLRSAKRHEKLSNMLKDLLGAKKLRDGAKSAVPDVVGAMQSSTSQLQQQQSGSTAAPQGKPPTLFAGLVTQVKNHTSPYHQPGTAEVNNSEKGPNVDTGPDCRSFVEKYGRCQEVIGRGSFGVVRISHKKLDAATNATAGQEKLYAVKEFKKKPNENEKKYNRRLTSEFCISSSLKHLNIIDTLDLLKDAKGDYCEVMEFCSGGDLYTLIIASGKLEYAEADCFFKQLIRGVNYMHDMGVAHRDLKPENLLLTQNGVLKITDFGNSECFKMAWEKEVQFSEGICGSSPYIAPEEFTQESFDPRCVDIWSCGVIYMAMRTGRQLWKLADPAKDEFFEEYLTKRKEASGYEPIESLKRARCRNVIYSILDPKPERRITGKQILNSEWGREIKVCDAGEGTTHEV
ncbi:SAT4 [Candida margitis]|uniref:SAT4 n=1 Tax=Candida margitis TaxID=1775924 RepID=UPI00222638F1|nr:SAT4 [Candida margitis]KAI5968186.1 SAT4 [Candida margitis]